MRTPRWGPARQIQTVNAYCPLLSRNSSSDFLCVANARRLFAQVVPPWEARGTQYRRLVISHCAADITRQFIQVTAHSEEPVVFRKAPASKDSWAVAPCYGAANA